MNTWKTKSSDDASKQIQEHQLVRATKHHHVTPISRIIEPQLPIYFRPFITIVWAHLWRGVELLNSQLENGRFGIPSKKPPRIDAYHFFLIGEKDPVIGMEVPIYPKDLDPSYGNTRPSVRDTPKRTSKRCFWHPMTSQIFREWQNVPSIRSGQTYRTLVICQRWKPIGQECVV